MEPGALVKYERFPDEVFFGYIMYLDTENFSEVTYHIRWMDGEESDEFESDFENGVIKVIQ
tara:strand:+ start:1397 stop:1579 length:183 start_codon:yes stop_codon:yes gene_type:complete